MTITDINAEIRTICDTDSVGLTDAVLLRRVNTAYEEVVGKIIGMDGRWQFDDTNFTKLPIGTIDLQDGIKQYSFDTSMLSILRLQILDNNGIEHLLKSIDQSDIHIALSEYQKTDGLPQEYDKLGDSVFLYPAPSTSQVTLTAGLKIFFERTASLFTSTDVTAGTKEPGFASPFHIILVYKASIPYCMSYKKDRVPLLLNEINRIDKALTTYYAKRQKDERHQITIKPISFR